MNEAQDQPVNAAAALARLDAAIAEMDAAQRASALAPKDTLAAIRSGEAARERDRLMAQTRTLAESYGVAPIDIPALAVLVLDDRPMSPDDIARGQELWSELRIA